MSRPASSNSSLIALRDRIRRIEQLTGRDLSSARNRIEFWLALRGRELAR